MGFLKALLLDLFWVTLDAVQMVCVIRQKACASASHGREQDSTWRSDQTRECLYKKKNKEVKHTLAE